MKTNLLLVSLAFLGSVSQASVTRYTCENSGYFVDLSTKSPNRAIVWTNENVATANNTRHVLKKTSSERTIDKLVFSDGDITIMKVGPLVTLSEGTGFENCK